MREGWRVWLDWQKTAHSDNRLEIDAIEADRGKTLGYIRVVGRRRGNAKLEDYCWPDTMRAYPAEYTKRPLLRGP